MFGIDDAVVGALGGSLISGLFGQSSAKASIKAQREALQNSHQWEVADLRKAGLNPILSATHGPVGQAGAQASMPDPNLGGVINGAKMAQVAKEAMQADVELKHQQAQKEGELAREAKVRADMAPEAIASDIGQKVSSSALAVAQSQTQDYTMQNLSANSAKQQAETENLRASYQNISQQLGNMKTEQQRLYEEIKYIRQQKQTSASTEKINKIEEKIRQQELNIGKAEEAKAAIDEKINKSQGGALMRIWERITGSLKDTPIPKRSPTKKGK